MGYTLRQKVGAAVLDWPRFEVALRASWVAIHNRNERLEASPDRRGMACTWQWTSDLHVAKVFPALGNRLLKRCLKDWPIEFTPATNAGLDDPLVSFVIGHRGRQRIPLLLSTIATIGAQRGVACECIVVEQSMQDEIREVLPPWVRYVHTRLPADDMPYCRSWALNVGARAARGRVLVFHDNDMLVPSAYASELWSRHQMGFEVVNLKRFIFYMGEDGSRQIQSDPRTVTRCTPDAIVQNLEAGGSVSVDRSAFLGIGGFDETFVGWGGEDNEFWERARLRRVWPYAHLPIVHLWHPAQPLKADPANPNLAHFSALCQIPPAQRAATLAARAFGRSEGLSVPWSTAPASASGAMG